MHICITHTDTHTGSWSDSDTRYGEKQSRKAEVEVRIVGRYGFAGTLGKISFK